MPPIPDRVHDFRLPHLVTVISRVYFNFAVTGTNANLPRLPLHKLRLLQKKAIRIISNTDYRVHSSKLFWKLKLLKLDGKMTFQLGTFMYKLKNNKLPSMIPHNVHQ